MMWWRRDVFPGQSLLDARLARKYGLTITEVRRGQPRREWERTV